MALYTLLDRLVYLIVEHWLVLTLIGILTCVIPSLYIIGFTNKSVVKTQKYLIAMILVLLAVAMFSLKVNRDLSHSIKTAAYRVEDYRIKNYRGKDCYFLNTNSGTKVVAKDSIKLEENDKPADKKHPAGTVLTYKQTVIKDTVPEYRQKLLQTMLAANNEGVQKPIKPVFRNELVRTNYR